MELNKCDYIGSVVNFSNPFYQQLPKPPNVCSGIQLASQAGWTIADSFMQSLNGTDSCVENDPNRNEGLLIVKPANVWLQSANKKPVMKKLFGEFWHEGELCILFADTNTGKSILAVQVGDSISKGIPILDLQLEVAGMPVAYIDFELSEKQFELRYSNNYQHHYVFANSFFRSEINGEAEVLNVSKDFEGQLVAEIERYISTHGVKCLIIDNITYLKHSTEKAKDALPLMKELKALKSKYGLSILVLAHTPKRDGSKPLTKNDLQGSKMLINFCDSAFAIGESAHDKSYRYIKQIKQRNTELMYGDDHVIVCEIEKPGSFLQFKLVGFGKESDHLRPLFGDKEERVALAQGLSQKGLSQREIAKELGVSAASVNGYLKR